MSSDLTLDFENHRQYPVMDSEAGIISIDQEGEWGKQRRSSRLIERSSVVDPGYQQRQHVYKRSFYKSVVLKTQVGGLCVVLVVTLLSLS